MVLAFSASISHSKTMMDRYADTRNLYMDIGFNTTAGDQRNLARKIWTFTSSMILIGCTGMMLHTSNTYTLVLFRNRTT